MQEHPSRAADDTADAAQSVLVMRSGPSTVAISGLLGSTEAQDADAHDKIEERRLSHLPVLSPQPAIAAVLGDHCSSECPTMLTLLPLTGGGGGQHHDLVYQNETSKG